MALRSKKSRVTGNPERIDKKLKRYGKRKGLRKGSRQYNAYVYGTVSHRMAGKYKRAHKGKQVRKHFATLKMSLNLFSHEGETTKRTLTFWTVNQEKEIRDQGSNLDRQTLAFCCFSF